jgi:hypothetical protein
VGIIFFIFIWRSELKSCFLQSIVAEVGKSNFKDPISSSAPTVFLQSIAEMLICPEAVAKQHFFKNCRLEVAEVFPLCLCFGNVITYIKKVHCIGHILAYLHLLLVTV